MNINQSNFVSRVSKMKLSQWLQVFLLVVISSASSAEILTTYYHNNALGSPVAATNEKGDILWRENYRAFGDKVQNLDHDVDPLTQDDNRVGYTGHVHDPDTGLTYMQARYYDPVLGRFYANDPVGFVEGNPLSFNRYAYANNNPYRFWDPDGKHARQTDGRIRNCAGEICVNIGPNRIKMFLMGGGSGRGTPRARTDSPGAGKTGSGAGSTKGQQVPGGGLQAHEDAGGHTISRHIGKTVEQLMNRLANSRISGSSSFPNLATAESAISSAINARSAQIQAFLSGNQTRTVINHTLPNSTGVHVSRGASSGTAVNSVRVVLERDVSLQTGYRIVTGYPVP